MIASFELSALDHFLELNPSKVIPDIYKANITESFLSQSEESYKHEYDEMIFKSVSEDSDSNLKDMNVILINPSFDEESNDDVYHHLVVAKKIKMHSDTSQNDLK